MTPSRSIGPEAAFVPKRVPLLDPVRPGYEHWPPQGGRNRFERRLREVWPAVRRPRPKGLSFREADSRRWVLLAGVCNALQERDYLAPGWNELQGVMNVLRRPQLPERFTVAYDVQTFYPMSGHGRFTGLYLDAPLGWVIAYEGRPVLLVSFGLDTEDRLFIAQAQLLTKRGNRWLYRIAGTPIEWAASVLAQNFPSRRVHVITGDSVARNVVASYADLDEAPAPDEVERIRQAYDAVAAGPGALVAFRGSEFRVLPGG